MNDCGSRKTTAKCILQINKLNVLINLHRMLELVLIAARSTHLALIAPKTIACGVTTKNVASIKMVICLHFLMDNVVNGLLSRIVVDLQQVNMQFPDGYIYLRPYLLSFKLIESSILFSRFHNFIFLMHSIE